MVWQKALVILYLLLNVSLMNPNWLTPPILHFVLSQGYPSTTYLNNQDISLFDHIHLVHENQGVLCKYLESDFHVTCVRCIHVQLSWKSYFCLSFQSRVIKGWEHLYQSTLPLIRWVDISLCYMYCMKDNAGVSFLLSVVI